MSESTPRLSPLHRIWRLLPAPARRWAFVHATTALAPAIDTDPPPAAAGLAIAGELTRASGLGVGARLMRDALHGLGVATWQIDVGDRLPGSPRPPPPVLPPPAAPIVFHINPPTLGWAMRQLPRDALRGRRIIGNWAWELPVMPPLWQVGLRLVHEVWVPSHFTAAAIASMLPADGRIPLRVVPHAVAAVPPRPAPLDRAAFGLPADAVVVLTSFNLASSMARKNPLAAIAAFRQAFGDRADRLLLLKIGHVLRAAIGARGQAAAARHLGAAPLRAAVQALGLAVPR